MTFSFIKKFFALSENLSEEPLKHIRRLEDAYRKSIRHPKADTLSILSIDRQVELSHHRLRAYILSLQKHTPADKPQLQPFFLKYLSQIDAIYFKTRRWIAFYADLRWPAEENLPGKQPGKRHDKERHRVEKEASDLWKDLEDKAKKGLWPEAREREIYLLKRQLDRIPANTSPWRVVYHKLCGHIYRYLRFILTESHYNLRNRFQITMAQEAMTGLFIEAQKTLTAAVPEDFREEGSGKSAWLIRLEDWLHGYYPFSDQLKDMYRRTVDPFVRFVRAGQRKRFRNLTAALVLAFVLSGLCLAALERTDADNRLWRVFVFELKKIFKFDAESLADKEKEGYFKTRVAAIGETYSPEQIRHNLRVFYAKRLYRSREGFLFFCRHILKGFFLLMADWNLDAQLKNDVVEAAYYLDGRIARSIGNIITLFGQQTIQEGALRNELLDLRRAFISYNVFPFTFIILEEDVPYLFLFSEPILKRYVFAEEAFQRLGMDREKVKRSELWPAVSYVVEGEEYPFLDRAGYFEGEFAIVFRRMTSHVEWTAFHETGHVVDHLRFRFENKPLPENIELNSMLAPVLWAGDRKEYISQRLVAETLKGDEFDHYSQASKGILNGLSIYLSEQNPGRKAPLISNRFEKDRIRRIAADIQKMDNDVLHEVAYLLYREPEKYLSTAEPGRYMSVMSNFQEVIYGTDHRIAQRGYILGGVGLVGPRSGPRFIFDGTADSVGGGFHLWSFLRNALSLIFYRSEHLPQATSAESIAAAVFVFIFFNLSAFFIHTLGAPYRKRRFYGRDPASIIDRIYNNNPWAKGYSFGAEQRERKLLKRVYLAKGQIDPQLKKDICAFKSTASDKERFIFDVCLFLAPLNPQKSAVVNKAHDLLFFLPFLGPYLGRALWIWPVQKYFHLREEYNDSIASMLTQIRETASCPSLYSRFKKIFYTYTPPQKNAPKARGDNVLDRVKPLVFDFLLQESRVTHMNFNFLRDKIPENNETSVEFDRLEQYMSGDDIRHIDWKATARYATSVPMVRRFSNPYGARVALWLDMRGLHYEEGRRLWARDFARSVKMFHLFRSETVLERLILIDPTGTLHEYPVRLSADRDCLSFSEKILTKIKERYEQSIAGHMTLDISGLDFYTSEENDVFLQQVALTDFMQRTEQEIRMSPLREKKMNIFMVGAKMSEKNLVETLAGDENRIFYW